MGLDLSDLLDVAHSYRVDDQTVTATVMGERETQLFNRARVKSEHPESQPVPRSIDDEDRETWGVHPEQQAATRAVMVMVGPPAAPRAGP